ncbi:MAG: PEP-CTERM sorting domain-containing protein, partial [Pirellulales bacterium]
TLGSPPTAESYSVSLVPSGSAFTNYSGSSSYNFTSTPGTILVTPAAAVPEPGTFGMLLTGMAGMFWLKRRRGRAFSAEQRGVVSRTTFG